MIARERAAKQEAKDAALIAEFDNVQARMKADALLAARLQEEEREQFSIDEQARFLYNSQLKYKSLEEIQKLYEREQKWINNFVPIDSEEGGKKVESSKKEASSSKKRQKTYPDDENVKRQKLEDAAEKEGLKAYLKIVPDEDRAITRADGSSKFYKVFSMMLEDFDRQDLADLHILVKEMSASRALEGYDLILWGDLKTMLEPIEQKYPLNQEMLTRILNWRLEADFENEMAYELIRFVKSQVQE
ncbi:hypothetical protein Tco_1494987 [Tanacetum coccineum]